jgi:adenylate cyclase
MAPRKKRKTIPIKKDRRNKRSILFYGIFITVLLFCLNLVRPTLTDFLNNQVYDAYLSAVKGKPSSIPVIVDIDEESLKQYGQWPWPRYRIAILIDKLRNLEAQSVGLDMLFAEEDRTSIHTIRKEMVRDFGVDMAIKDVPDHLRNNDQRLSQALSKGSVVLGYQFLFDKEGNPENCLLHPLQANRLEQGGAEKNPAPFIHARNVTCNLNIFSQAAAGSGFFNVLPDPDGILRRVPLVIEYRGKLYPSLALQTLMQSSGTKTVLLRTGKNGAESLSLNRTTIPLSPEGNMLLRFRGKGRTFDYISAGDLLSDRVPPEKIKGKIVFVGTSASGLKELRSTPFDPVFPGVEVHATLVDNILKKDFVSRPTWAAGLEFLSIILFGLFSAFVLAWTGAGRGSILLGAAAVGAWQASVWVFRGEGIFISPVLPLAVLVCNFSILTFLRYWQEEKRVKERTRELAMVQEATIESMSSLTETRDPDTGGHIKRTQNYLRLLAEHLKRHPRFSPLLDDDTIDLLCKSAPLHDIGKVGVSDRILLKAGKLTDQEFEEMKQHTVYGRDTIISAERKLGTISFLRFAREIAYTHHERWDGTGYPEGLKGEQIPVPGRLMALADTYDALTSERVYKSPFSHEEAVRIILEARGTQFDPAVVDAFIEAKEEFSEIARKYADT